MNESYAQNLARRLILGESLTVGERRDLHAWLTKDAYRDRGMEFEIELRPSQRNTPRLLCNFRAYEQHITWNIGNSGTVGTVPPYDPDAELNDLLRQMVSGKYTVAECTFLAYQQLAARDQPFIAEDGSAWVTIPQSRLVKRLQTTGVWHA